MLKNADHVTQSEIDERTRRRIWARVQIGMEANRRRRRRRAWLATLCGAGIAILATAILMLV